MPRLPKTVAAWLLTILGNRLLVFALALHWGMFLMVFGHKRVSPGRGEFAVALFGRILTVLLSSALLAAASIRTAWRSAASVIAVGAGGGSAAVVGGGRCAVAVAAVGRLH